MGDKFIFCSNCKKSIAEVNYMLHSVHCERKIQLCNFCAEPVLREEMKHHLEEYHAKTNCPKCNAEMEKYRLEDHKNVCNKRLAACKFCDLELSLDKLPEHIESCGSRTQKCSRCNKFVTLKDHSRHKKICHETLEKYSKNFSTCGVCNLDFPTSLLQEHNAVCGLQTEICSACGIEVKNINRDRHKLTCQRVEIPCEFCGKCFLEHEFQQHADICMYQETLKSVKDNFKMPYDTQLNEREKEYPDSYICCEFCSENVIESTYAIHKENCALVLENCKNCHHKVMRKYKEKHLAACLKVISKQYGTCSFCRQEVPWVDMSMHETICEVALDDNSYADSENNVISNLDASDKAKFQNEKFKIQTNCKHCKRKLPPLALEEHVKICPKNIYTCEACSEEVVFQQKKNHDLYNCRKRSYLRSHVPYISDENVSEQKKNPIFKQCVYCEESFPEYSFRSHLDVCVERPYTCDRCQKSMAVKEKGRHECYLRFEDFTSKKNSNDAESVLEGATALPPKEYKKMEYLSMQSEVCPNCNSKIPVHNYSAHLNQCYENMKRCHFCGEDIPAKEEKNHVKVCVRRTNVPEENDFKEQCKNKKKGKHKHQQQPEERKKTVFQSVASIFSQNKGQRTSSKDPVRRSDASPVLVPCEFCSELFPFEIIIDHQSGCRPDLISYPKKEEQSNPGEQEDKVRHFTSDKLHREMSQSSGRQFEDARIKHNESRMEDSQRFSLDQSADEGNNYYSQSNKNCQRTTFPDHRNQGESLSSGTAYVKNGNQRESHQMEKCMKEESNAKERKFTNIQNDSQRTYLGRGHYISSNESNFHVSGAGVGRGRGRSRSSNVDSWNNVGTECQQKSEEGDRKEVKALSTFRFRNVSNDSSDEESNSLKKSDDELQFQRSASPSSPIDSASDAPVAKGVLKAIGAERAERRNCESPRSESPSSDEELGNAEYTNTDQVTAHEQKENFQHGRPSSPYHTTAARRENNQSSSWLPPSARSFEKEESIPISDKNFTANIVDAGTFDNRYNIQAEEIFDIGVSGSVHSGWNNSDCRPQQTQNYAVLDEESFDAKNEETFRSHTDNFDDEIFDIGEDEPTRGRFDVEGIFDTQRGQLSKPDNKVTHYRPDDSNVDTNVGSDHEEVFFDAEDWKLADSANGRKKSDEGDLETCLKFLSKNTESPDLNDNVHRRKERITHRNCNNCGNEMCYCSIANLSLEDGENIPDAQGNMGNRNGMNLNIASQLSTKAEEPMETELSCRPKVFGQQNNKRGLGLERSYERKLNENSSSTWAGWRRKNSSGSED